MPNRFLSVLESKPERPKIVKQNGRIGFSDQFWRRKIYLATHIEPRVEGFGGRLGPA
jgi:hypothetical protein